MTVNCDQNYWGAPSGPGADPADQVCQATGGGTIVENSTVSLKKMEIKALK